MNNESNPVIPKSDDSVSKIKAYAILAGGGVKGAALVGALKAAERYVTFEGYGGASAGSIVALLASLGYEHDELYELTVNTDLSKLLDDKEGKALKRFRNFKMKRYLPKAYRAFGDYFVLSKIRRNLGIYKGQELSSFIRRVIIENDKFSDLKTVKYITFRHLLDRGAKQLKIIVSDINRRRPIIYSGSGKPWEVDSSGKPWEVDDSIVRAIRASISFPFIFIPVEDVSDDQSKRYLVDGGLCSNLPVFLFAREHRETGYPVLAFDLIPPEKKPHSRYRVRDFCSDLISTALEASDGIHRDAIGEFTRNIHYIPIKIPEGIDTFKIPMTDDERERLYDRGFRDASETLDKIFRNEKEAKTEKDKIQVILNVPDSLVSPLLKGFIQEMQEKRPAGRLRAHVMLPSGKDKLVLTYQFGFTDDDPDKYFKVGTPSKWVRKVFNQKEPTISDLEKLRAQPGIWGMKAVEVEMIRQDRQTLLSVPILEARANAAKVEEFPCLGILSVDTDTPIQYTSWGFDDRTAVMVAMRWADIVSRIIS